MKKQEKTEMDIGIDFGSTYSLITTFDDAEQKLRELKPQGDTAVTPSYISIDKEDDTEINFGTFAKSRVYDKNYTHFSGFKMMLVENNPETLRANGYTDKNTPKYITRLFLEHMLNGILLKENPAGSSIDIKSGYNNVYICVPELWAKHAKTIDGCYTLRKILTEELGIKKVTIVMEPEAASAYFAYIYEKNTGRSFNGHLFLIDFGGGTLDVTLSKVVSDGFGSITIKRVSSDGLGENHKDIYGMTESGKAGMAYIQRLVLNVLSRNGINDADAASPDFKETVVEIENTLMSSKGISGIRDTFSRFSNYSQFRKIFDKKYSDISDARNIFTRFRYQGKKYPVRYAELFEAYKQVIEKGFGETIKKMCDVSRTYTHKDPCTIEAGEDDDFKIALVGGFGSFYFVQKQIEEIFNIDDINYDCRTKGLTVSENEKAISYGAALFAAEKVILKKTASYALGLQVTNKNDNTKRHLIYAIRYSQEISANTIYYVTESNGHRSKFTSVHEVIHRLISNDCTDDTRGYTMMMKYEYIRTLSTLPTKGIFYIGFSIDENHLITMHIVSASDETIDYKYPLDNYEMMFDMQTVDDVYEGESLTEGKF